MKDEPTLADMMIREWSKPKYRTLDSNGWIPRTVAQARKFVLDKSMSEYLADLGYSWLPGLKKGRSTEILNGYRMLSRLPHPVTWIEYDLHARVNRSIIQWNHLVQSKRQDAQHMPRYSGWLLMQHPKIDTSFMAFQANSHSIDGPDNDEGTKPLMPRAVMAFYPIVWSVDDCVPAYPNRCLAEQSRDDIAFVGGWLTSIKDFYCPQVDIVPAPWLTGKKADTQLHGAAFRHAIAGHAGDLRFLWSLLAAINDTPILTRQVRPTKGHMVRGNYKRFSEHSVITLNIPHRVTMAQLAKRALRATRRRAHMVRGHWRRDWRFPLSPMCEHRFEPVPDTQLSRCTRCLGRKMWITEHQSGDASLGFVLHDYQVHHKEGAP